MPAFSRRSADCGSPSSTSRSGRPADTARAPASATRSCAAARPSVSASSDVTCSASGSPLAAARLALIRATSTVSPPSSSAAQDAAEPVRLSRSASGSHSACQAPAARWYSCSAAAAMVASRPGTRLVQPRMAMAATGFCFCGMAEEPPRRGELPPAAPETGAGAFVHLGHLGLRQERDVAGDLAEDGVRAGQRRGQLDQPQPVRVPGQGRQRQRQLLGQQRRHPRPAVPQRRQRARGPAELDRQPPGADRRQAGPRVIQRGQPARGHQPERDGHGLLEQRPADHDGGPVRVRQRRRGLGRGGQVGADDVKRVTGQQHRGRVHDVLAGRAAVHGAGRGPGHLPGQRAAQRGNGVAGERGQFAQVRHVEVPRHGRLGHRGAGAGGSEPGPLQRAGQARLHVQHGPQPRVVTRVDPAAAEHATEEHTAARVLLRHGFDHSFPAVPASCPPRLARRPR